MNAAHSGARRPAQRGFTLLEAIVALTLVATTGMALFSWINSGILALQRVQEHNGEDLGTANALDYLATINPSRTPEGSAQLGQARIRWHATASTEARDNAGYPFGTGLFQVRLYDTRVDVEKPDGSIWYSFTVTQVGYEKVREKSRLF